MSSEYAPEAQLAVALAQIKELEAEAIRLDEARHEFDLQRKAQIIELERQFSDCKADLDSEVLEGDAFRVSDAAIRELCGAPGDDRPTLELVRTTIMGLETEEPCNCCGNPRGNCMKLVAGHILSLPAFRENDDDPPAKDE